MNRHDKMTARARAEFDRMVAERERDLRLQMRAAGASLESIEVRLDSCRPALAEQRAAIGSIVTVALLKAGIPNPGSANHVLP